MTISNYIKGLNINLIGPFYLFVPGIQGDL